MAKRRDILQNLAYLVVIFGQLPLAIVAGLAMSPRLGAVWPGWFNLLGGRKFARTLHFLAASGPLLLVLDGHGTVHRAGRQGGKMSSLKKPIVSGRPAGASRRTALRSALASVSTLSPGGRDRLSNSQPWSTCSRVRST